LCETTGAVDPVDGVIHGVKILGLTGKDGRQYTETTLRRAVSLFEGAKVNMDRAARSTQRSVRDRLGAVCNVRFVEGQGIVADLHFNAKHAQAGQLAWDAEHNPEAATLSPDMDCRTTRASDGALVVTEITKVVSLDLVAGSETSGGLFEHVTEAESERCPLSGPRPLAAAGNMLRPPPCTGLFGRPSKAETTEFLRRLRR
jgi:hypothetical protein